MSLRRIIVLLLTRYCTTCCGIAELIAAVQKTHISLRSYSTSQRGQSTLFLRGRSSIPTTRTSERIAINHIYIRSIPGRYTVHIIWYDNKRTCAYTKYARRSQCGICNTILLYYIIYILLLVDNRHNNTNANNSIQGSSTIYLGSEGRYIDTPQPRREEGTGSSPE